MPSKPMKPCLENGCAALVQSGRCEAHKANGRQAYDRRRGTARQRLYDSDWEKFRALFLRRHPFCVGSAPGWSSQDPPASTNHIVLATEVHHIQKVREFPELRLVESNCLGQCASCHATRTRRGE